MTKKNSNSLRCRQCGMINWATDEYCRRCHQLLDTPSAQTESGISPKRFQLYVYIYIAAIVLPILVGQSSPEIGAGLALLFMVVAWIINVFCAVGLIVDKFRVSVVWGLAGIFLAPISSILFIVMYWDRARIKFLTSLAVTPYIFIIFIAMNQLVKPANIAQKTAGPQPTPMTRYLDATPTPKPDFLQPRKDLLKKKPSDK